MGLKKAYFWGTLYVRLLKPKFLDFFTKYSVPEKKISPFNSQRAEIKMGTKIDPPPPGLFVLKKARVLEGKVNAALMLGSGV